MSQSGFICTHSCRVGAKTASRIGAGEVSFEPHWRRGSGGACPASIELREREIRGIKVVLFLYFLAYRSFETTKS